MITNTQFYPKHRPRVFYQVCFILMKDIGIEENTGGVMYIYIESGHHVVLLIAGGLRCHGVATSTIIK